MSVTVEAELRAIVALREYLLRTLPAKVATINAGRAAVLKSALAGPFTVPAGLTLKVGTVKGTYSDVALTSGARTATQVAAEIDAGVAGVTVSVDTQQRLVITSDTLPSGETPSVVALGPDDAVAPAVNALFGWPEQGTLVLRSAIVAPHSDAVWDGNPGVFDLDRCFHVTFGKRATTPRSKNIRDDVHHVSLEMEIRAVEKFMEPRSMPEITLQCIRAVREVIYEDRTLDGRVVLTELPALQSLPETYILGGGSPSPLYGLAKLTARIHVYERS